MNSFSVVRSMLSPRNLMLLRKSCFGHFFESADFQFQGQLFCILLKKLVKSSKQRNRLSFRINKQVIDFGPAEYALMTGLKFSAMESPPDDSEIYQNVFNGKRFLQFKSIDTEFRKECKSTDGDSEMSLKLGLLYVLYGVLDSGSDLQEH